MLREVEGLAAAEVSALLGISDGNQRVLLHRGRATLREGGAPADRTRPVDASNDPQ